MAATSSSMPGQWCQTFVIGRATYSAKAPVPADAQADAVSAEVPPPGQAVAAASADDVALAADEVAGREIGDVGASLHDAAHELVADDERRLDRPRRPGVPRLDVQVRAADAGLARPG